MNEYYIYYVPGEEPAAQIIGTMLADSLDEAEEELRKDRQKWADIGEKIFTRELEEDDYNWCGMWVEPSDL